MSKGRLAVSAAALLCLSANGVRAQQWPDLTVLQNYPNPFGPTCDVNGSPSADAEKKASNRLKNRFTVPDHPETLGLDAVIALPPGPGGAAPSASDPNQSRGVVLTGFVRDVKPGGTHGESCNCKATGPGEVDSHIEVILNPATDNTQEGRRMVVVEVTERSRRLASQGLLHTNIGNDWSQSILRGRLLSRWVRFTGWLFYDADHHLESWRIDPNNHIDGNNWRATAWEVHPVMGIEVLPGRPADIPRPPQQPSPHHRRRRHHH